MASKPVPRQLGIERQLCEAIGRQVTVRLRYKDDFAERVIAPYGVYFSTTCKVNLTGTQIDNPGKPSDKWEPRILEVGLVRSVTITDTEFKPDPRFDPSEPRYQNGFICRIK